MKIHIFPSLIAADQLHLGQVIKELEPFCDGFHLDVMDNHFVPNLTWGPLVVNAIAAYIKKILFVHIMAENPEKIIQQLMLKPHDIVSFHSESKSYFNNINKIIREKNALVCLAISPKTDLEQIFSYLPWVDQVLLMSVHPGFSGQTFLKESIERLKALQSYKQQHGLKFEIGMDGGISEDTIYELIQNGATSFAVGSSIFSQKNPVAALKKLYEYAQR